MRVCFENNAIAGQIDTTGCTNLRDFRAAWNYRWNPNAFTNVIFTPESASNIFHLCMRDEPQLAPHWLEQNATNFPSLKELIFWNTGQTGAVNLNYTTNLTYVQLDKDPQIVAVQFTNCPNLQYLTVSNCYLSSNAMEQILASLWANSLQALTAAPAGDNYAIVALNGNGPTTPLGYYYFTNIQAVILRGPSQCLIDWPPTCDGTNGGDNSVTFVIQNQGGATAYMWLFTNAPATNLTWHWSDGAIDRGTNVQHTFTNQSVMYHTNYVTVGPPSAAYYFGKRQDDPIQGIIGVYGVSSFPALHELYLYHDSLKDLSLANCSSNLIQLHLATNPGITNCDQWFADVVANSPQTNSYGSALFYYPTGAATWASTNDQMTLSNRHWYLFPCNQ